MNYCFYGIIVYAGPCGEDSIRTINFSSFNEACMRIGALMMSFPSCAVLKCVVVNEDDNTSTVIWEIDEASKKCSYRFAKENKHYHEMYSTLQKNFAKLEDIHSAYNDYLYSGKEFHIVK